MKHLTRTDSETCHGIAALIRNIAPRKAFYERPFLKQQGDDELRFRGYFYSVAICHQTYLLRNTDLNLYGWDYIEYVFTRLMSQQDKILEPGFIVQNDPQILSGKIASLFPANSGTSESTLDRIQERTKMLIELDRYLRDHYENRITNLIHKTGNKLLNEGSGFYEILESLIAFSDPLRKKSTFLIKLLEDADLLHVEDPDNFIPIMDYHMQRVLIRTGCVEIMDPDYRNELIQRIPQEDDTVLRQTCIEAFREIARISGHPITRLNDIFWSLGRSCCNENPLCQAGHCEKSPCTFFQIVELENHVECFFKDHCKGCHDDLYRSLWQPMVNTHYY